MRRLSKYRIAIFVAAMLVMLVTATVAVACPGCKDAVAANDPQQAGIVKGYFYSILLMMGTPFAMVACFSLYMYREVQKARAAKTAKQSEPRARGFTHEQQVHDRETVEV